MSRVGPWRHSSLSREHSYSESPQVEVCLPGRRKGQETGAVLLGKAGGGRRSSSERSSVGAEQEGHASRGLETLKIFILGEVGS